MSDKATYDVLLVDDEEASYEFVDAMLRLAKTERYNLTWLTDFASASDALLSGNFDVCLLDYNLGDYTGLELFQHVKSHGSRVPFVLLTGHSTSELDRESLQAGIVEYLDKSQIRPELLSRTLRYTVKRQQDSNTLKDLYDQVHELEQLKTDMIRIAAHDLRTPLMSALNYAQFLKTDRDHPLQDYQIGYAEEIMQSVYRMQQIITDILSLERIQETADDRYEQITDLAQQTQQAVADAQPTNRLLNIQIDVPNSAIQVKGDAAQLREASTNLIDNAIKYTPDGGTITITLTTIDEQAHFTVTDTGYGIPDNMQERLFQPFYRAKSKETRNISGTGLGLHLVRNIVRRHNGELIFKSTYGEGSVFGFRLPIFKDKQE